MFFTLPAIIRTTAAARSVEQSTGLDAFLRSRVDIGTGWLTGAEAWLQVLIFPLSLAFAAVTIGTVSPLNA